MSKLYFRYGTVSSAKTANLLLVAHNYRQQGKNIFLIKPSIDTRTKNFVYSRCGLQTPVDLLLEEKHDLNTFNFDKIDCILCDEAQFLIKKHVEQLRYIATYKSIPVICYGLKTDYRGELFSGSYSLLCLSDSIEEIKTTCAYCNKKGIMNLKFVDGKPINTGDDTPDLGFDEKYVSCCYKHYNDMIKE